MDFDVFIKGESIDLVVLTNDLVEKTNCLLFLYNFFNLKISRSDKSSCGTG